MRERLIGDAQRFFQLLLASLEENDERFRELHTATDVVTERHLRDAIAGDARQAALVIRSLLHNVEVALGRDIRPTDEELDITPIVEEDGLRGPVLLWRRLVNLWRMLRDLKPAVYHQLRDSDPLHPSDVL
jgi:hypothetical protein